MTPEPADFTIQDVYRALVDDASRNEMIAPYIGIYRYTLVRQQDGRFLIRRRRAELDLERLTDHGAVSIIL